ncbi:ABC transporter permease subunit [Pseudooceanicola sediminis]|uniref:ABC transporter permease subunit n=1 Tax=Pseudooceanicola sediminis TaxID=2211117 RepID=A0A399J230_9RHOB|nr:ABC transporter permease subunit [Pseudooceanicola sediminis]KAA2314512.1 ABC transporter permease subunit [Puniceibacterium sp. HSS470]RII39493.1 ABC transporter permease subunit [Pseudooceanicola sediminis]|tara:strand:- start:64940 stop:66196 length:1257 start_codon:yes stop_codon:yes gene_type:complete
MTTLTDPPAESFKLSMLVYDTRYRSITFQILALVAVLLLFGWLTMNTAQNLNDLGKEPSFSFLGESAGYDINQRLIDYSSQSTHLRAAFVGLLNTLLVAAMGCATATVIGVIVGVLRLSGNWLVARLMTVYVEMFRNVPVLMWIVLCMAILIEAMPPPSAFRGDDPDATMKLFDSVAITNRGVYIPEPLFSRSLGDFHVGAAFDVSINLIAILIVLGASIFVARGIARRADAKQEATGLRPRTWHTRLAVIVLPTVVLLAILGFHLGYPELKGFNFAGGTYMRNSLIALWLALSLYTAAFIAEIVRAGILAISSGQTEAAAALGLRNNRIMSLVVLPQAMRVIIPPLISQYLNLTKNSSLAIAVGYMDITGTLMGITLNQTGRELETVLLGMLVYLAISLIISGVMNWYNNRVKLVER